MKLPVRLRKTKLRQKKQRLQKRTTNTAAPPVRPHNLQQSPAVAKIAANPTTTTKTERDSALQSLNAEIENAKNLPPAAASLLLRVAYFLRQVILNLDSDNAINQEEDAERQDATGQEARASDLTDASDEQNRQPNNEGSASANERLAAT